MITLIKNVNNIQTGKIQPQGAALAFAWFFVNFNLGLLIKMLLIKQKMYNIIKSFGNMFRRKVRPQEMKRYTLLGCTDQANVRLFKDRIFARAIQCYLLHCQKKL